MLTGIGKMSSLKLNKVKVIKIGIIPAHATMQYGQRTLITRSDWLKSQSTKMKPSRFPTQNNLQNHIANFAPARIAKPTTIGAMNDAIPISGLGKPKRLACGVSITDLQDIKTFRSQPRTAFGSARTWNFSKVSENAPIQPVIPPRMMVQARDLGAEIPVFTLFSVLTGQVWHYSLQTFRGIRAILKVVDFVHTEIDEGLAGTQK